MAGEAFEVKGVAQGSHELTRQSFSALSTYLAAALGLGGGLVHVSGVGRGAGGVGHAVVGREGGRRGSVVGGAAHEAVGVGVIVVVVLGALVIHRRRSLRWCAHIRLRQV